MWVDGLTPEGEICQFEGTVNGFEGGFYDVRGSDENFPEGPCSHAASVRTSTKCCEGRFENGTLLLRYETVMEAYEALRNHNVGYHAAGYGTFKGVTFQKVARTVIENTQAQNWLKRHAQKSNKN